MNKHEFKMDHTLYPKAMDNWERPWLSSVGGFPMSYDFPSPDKELRDLLALELGSSRSSTREAAEGLIEIIKEEYHPEIISDKPITQQVVSFAYENTAMGGCRVINPLPQFNVDDDPPPKNRRLPTVEYDSILNGTQGDGIGVVYNKMYLENMHILYLRVGKVKFEHLTSFLSQAVDVSLLNILTSTDTSLSYKLGSIVGSGIGIAIMIPTLPFILAGRILTSVSSGRINETFKFCTFKPDMHLYYKTWSYLAANMLVHMGLAAGAEKLDSKDFEDASNKAFKERLASIEKAAKTGGIENLKTEFGDGWYMDTGNEAEVASTEGELKSRNVMTEGQRKAIMSGRNHPRVIRCGADVTKVLSLYHDRRNSLQRPLRTAARSGGTYIRGNEIGEKVEALLNTAAAKKIVQITRQAIATTTGSPAYTYTSAFITDQRNKIEHGVEEVISAIKEDERSAQVYHDLVAAGQTTSEVIETAGAAVKKALSSAWEKIDSWIDETQDAILSQALGELNFLAFRIEEGRSVNTSVSHSTTAHPMAGYFKSSTGIGRVGSSMFLNGTTGIPGLDQFGQVLKGIVESAGAKTTLLGVSTLMIKNSGHLDIPEIWSDSSTSQRSHTLTLELRTPNPTPENVYQHIMFPLMGILAFTFPLGFGKSSYGAPPMLQAFSPGLLSYPLAMAKSVSIECGASEYGWTNQNLPKMVKVSVEIEDMSPSLFISLTDAKLWECLSSTTSMQEYLMTLSGVGFTERLHSHTLRNRRWTLTKMLINDTYFNPDYWIRKVGQSGPARTLGGLAPARAYRVGRR